jgi:6,7-dimethyl-8-ribityllumazine synthase
VSTNLRSPNPPDGASDVVDGTGRRVALVCARFNDLIVERLERGARRALVDHGVADDAISTFWVPGALEIPQVARAAAATGRFDAVVALGAVVRGDTYHFEVVSDASAAGLMQLSLDTSLGTRVVITNAILTVDDEAQAIVRAGDDDGNKGAQAAIAALETLSLIDSMR